MRSIVLMILFIASFCCSAIQVQIGMSAPFSGPTQNLGNELKIGAATYLAKYNASQKKFKVNLITLDDGYEPDRMAKNTQAFLQHNVTALFSYVGTPTTSFTLPIIQRSNAILFAPYTGAEFLRTPVKKNIFNIRASYYLEAETQVQYFVDHLKLTNVALFIQADEFGIAASKGFIHSLNKRGISPKQVVRYKRNTEDIIEASTALQAVNADVIFCVGTYMPVSALVSNLRYHKIKSRIATLSFSGAESLKSHLKYFDQIYISSVMPNPHESQIPLVKQYRQDMKGKNLSHETLEGYVNALFFTQILDLFENTPTSEQFIEKANDLTLSYGGMTFGYSDNSRQGLNRAYLNQITQKGLIPVNSLTKF